MKNNLQIEQLLKEISFKIIEYEEGDMILISEIIEGIKVLSINFTGNVKIENEINITLCVLEELLNGTKIENDKAILSNEIGLITRIYYFENPQKGKKLTHKKNILIEEG